MLISDSLVFWLAGSEEAGGATALLGAGDVLKMGR
jgi:hypothetical protein